MRPRRTLFSSLAPLIGLSALIAVAAAGPESPRQSGAPQHPLVRLIHSVFQFVAPAAEAPSLHSAARRPSSRAMLSMAAFQLTPLGHSLWMVAADAVALPSIRLQRRRLLRC
ncbi:MAG TPA: hypothetical protein VH639_13150 [Bryobacteraceae bacterium]